MKKHDFQYFFHEGISNMFSHGFMSFATVGITIACLLIMGTFSLVSLNANANLQSLQDQSVILAFVDESYTEAEAKALQPQIERISNVASVDFIGKEEAMETYVDETGRTVLWRRFNRDDWARHHFGQRWSEKLPENEQLMVDDTLYVHWYDCITDYIL